MKARRRRLVFSIALLVLLLAVVAVLIIQLPASLLRPHAIPQEDGAIEVHFCPAEDCEAVLLAAMNQSSGIRCALYDLDLPVLENILLAKNASVLVFDESYRGFGTSLPNARGGLMHDKFCVLGNGTVITGSANPTSGLFKNDNDIVIIRGAYLAENYLAAFENLRTGKERTVPYPLIAHTVFYTNNSDTNASYSFLIENYFCPEDGCQGHVLSVLRSANASVRFLTYSFTDDAIGDALVGRAAAGVSVSGVFEKSQESKYSEYAKLKAAGLDVRLDGNSALMHHKVFIVDDAIVVTGSYNPTANGNSRNDENVLIIHDAAIAAQYRTEFGRVYAQAPSN